jgi:hypothetical protein
MHCLPLLGCGTNQGHKGFGKDGYKGKW